MQDNPLPGDLAVSTDGSVVLAVTRADFEVVDAKDGRVLWQVSTEICLLMARLLCRQMAGW